MRKKRLTPEEEARRALWVETRFKVNEAVRRYKALSSHAYRLWAELAFGWSWNDHSCFPNYEALSTTLGWHRNTVSKFMNELVAEGLVERKRGSFGYFYSLVTDLPDRYWAGKLNNKVVIDGLRGRKSKRKTAHAAHDGVDQPAGSDAHDGGHHDAHDGGHHRPDDAHDGGHHDAHDGVDAYKQMNREADELPEEADELKAEEPASPAFSEHSGMRGSSGTQGSTTVAMAEADELISETGSAPVSRPTRKKVKPRAGSPALVSGDGRTRAPFPDALGASGSASHTQFDPPPPPPPVAKPEDVLRLLAGEAETRWGKKATRGYPMALSGELSGQIKNVLLSKYAPDVILAMVRLLVWDWEVARGACFPFRKDVTYPDLKALIQYAGELASRIETGFNYMETRRGALNSYHDLFIRKIPFIPDDDPF